MLLVGAVAFGLGLLAGVWVAALGNAAHVADATTELLCAANAWATVANGLTAAGWQDVTPEGVLDALTVLAEADVDAWLAE